MRVCAVSLPELRIEVVRAETAGPNVVAAKGPLGIVVAEPPMTEQKLLGNMRLDVVSREARKLGVAPRQTIAQARSRASDLEVRVVRPDVVKSVLARLSEIALAFGATVAFDVDPDRIWVDITGCAHLHAPDREEGEALLATRLCREIAAAGHACAVAVADGPRVAAMLARSSGESAARSNAFARGDYPVLVVPAGKNADAISDLSIVALPIAEQDMRWLTKIGVRTLAELRALPRASLGARLGACATDVIALAHGEDRAPLTPYVPPSVPEEEVELEYGVEGSVALTFVTKTLSDRLAARLSGRAVSASRLELRLLLDGGMLAAGEPRTETVAIELSAPLHRAPDLLAAFRPKLERLVLRAPVLAATLRAPVLVANRQTPLSLFSPVPKAELALPRLVAELSSDLGVEAVGKLCLGDAWTAEDRSLFVRLGDTRRTQRKRHHRLSSVPEPTRVLAEPMEVHREHVRIVRHLSRVEAVDWWKKLPSRAPKKGVDYVYAWVDDVDRSGAPAWVEIDRANGAARVRGWFD